MSTYEIDGQKVKFQHFRADSKGKLHPWINFWDWNPGIKRPLVGVTTELHPNPFGGKTRAVVEINGVQYVGETLCCKTDRWNRKVGCKQAFERLQLCFGAGKQ